MTTPTRDTLYFPTTSRPFLEPHLPPPPSSPQHQSPSSPYPFTTLTFATSLDSSLSLSPGTQTALSGAETKSLTHYLRSRHDAILIGVGTALADNPSLNCRLDGVGGYGGEALQGQPQPVIIDPRAKFQVCKLKDRVPDRAGSEEAGEGVEETGEGGEETREGGEETGEGGEETGEKEWCKLLQLVKQGKGRAPWIIAALPPNDLPPNLTQHLEQWGGKYISITSREGEGPFKLDWEDILAALAKEGIKSVMVEGGGGVINSLLNPRYFHLVDSVIVTIAPVWLGQGGVVVSPERRYGENGAAVAALRLKDVQWQQFGQDVVMCGKIKG